MTPDIIRRRAQSSDATPPCDNKDSTLLHFLAQETQVMVAGAPQRVLVGPDALLLWWGADSGPQTAEGLVEAHATEIEEAVIAKLARGFRPRSNVIRIGEDDLD